MILGAFLGLSVASCADQNFDWEEAKSQNPEYVFRSNFEKLFGKIDPDQCWDFSTAGKKTGTRAAGDATVAKPSSTVPSDWYEVDQTTLNWMKEQLPEGVDNTTKGQEVGESFGLAAPANSFKIIPIYQGHASSQWDLWMVVGDQEYKIWEKSEDIQIIPANTAETQYTEYQSIDKDGDTMTAQEVKSGVITISGVEEGEMIYFYLKMTTDGAWWNGEAKHVYQPVDTKESSLAGMMRGLYCNAPSNLNTIVDEGVENAKVMILGCEDNHQVERKTIDINDDGYPTIREASDWDMNDIVFMIVGQPELPEPIKVENDEIEKLDVCKRYMVEDLGSTETTDIDFNDIVVDLEQYYREKLTITNGVITNRERVRGSERQQAVVRAMGGTMDFVFYVNNVAVVQKSNTPQSVKTMWNTGLVSGSTINEGQVDAIDYVGKVAGTYTYSVTGWNPTANNVKFEVTAGNKVEMNSPSVVLNVNEDGTTKMTISFPEDGDVPFILAFDPTKQWRPERYPICNHWILTDEDSGQECTEEHDDQGL